MHTKTLWSNLLDALVMTLLAVGALLAQSQPPTPGPTKTTQKDQGKAIGKQGVTSDNQSESDVVSTAINKLSSEITTWKNQQAAENTKHDSSSGGWLMWSTIMTAIATFAIAGLGGFQWWAMHKQRIAMELQAGYMKDALTETTKAANAAKESARIADLSLRITQRPIVLIHSMEMISPRGPQNAYGRYIKSFIVVAFKNVGASIAEGFYYTIKVTSNGFASNLPITVSHKTALQPQMPIIEPLPILGDMFPHNPSYIISGIADKTLRVTGFVRYKGALDVTGTYVEFTGVYDALANQFLITQSIAEDVGQSPAD